MFARLTESTHKAQNRPVGAREAVLGLPSPNCTPPRGVGSAFRAAHLLALPRAEARG
jgi:hypothetical protein